MCIAELNVSLNTCAHRWYHLVRPCVEGANLQACPTRLALEGWEIKCDFCPFCAGWPLGGGEFMLLGSHPHSRSSSFSAPLSRTPSMTTSVSAARRDSRRGSMAISETSNTSAPGSPVFTTSERNRSMNNRVDSYFIAHPESITQTQQKRPGTSATGVWSNWAASTSEANVEGRRGSASTSSTGSAKAVPTEKTNNAWMKAKRRSRDLTGFFR